MTMTMTNLQYEYLIFGGVVIGTAVLFSVTSYLIRKSFYSSSSSPKGDGGFIKDNESISSLKSIDSISSGDSTVTQINYQDNSLLINPVLPSTVDAGVSPILPTPVTLDTGVSPILPNLVNSGVSPILPNVIAVPTTNSTVIQTDITSLNNDITTLLNDEKIKEFISSLSYNDPLLKNKIEDYFNSLNESATESTMPSLTWDQIVENYLSEVNELRKNINDWNSGVLPNSTLPSIVNSRVQSSPILPTTVEAGVSPITEQQVITSPYLRIVARAANELLELKTELTPVSNNLTPLPISANINDLPNNNPISATDILLYLRGVSPANIGISPADIPLPVSPIEAVTINDLVDNYLKSDINSNSLTQHDIAYIFDIFSI